MSSRKYRFDGWVFEPDSGDLERAGSRVRLQEQPARVLQELIAHGGTVVTREQLIALLWPKGVVDFDTSLNTAVRKLRSALGDVAETPRYIETLPRRGYRFVGTLDPAPPADSRAECAGVVEAGPSATGAPGAGAMDAGHLTAGTPGAGAMSAGALSTDALAAEGATSPQPSLPYSSTLKVVAGLAAAILIGLLGKRLWLTPNAPPSSSPPPPLTQTAPVMHPAPPTVGTASIAVLPFVDMSERKDQEYFSDGLSEELIDKLGQTPGLRVIARTSSFYFKGKSQKLESIAQELQVANVLEGSVRKEGARLRVTAQLIRAATSEHLWSETFDRDLHDVFRVQDEIAAAVVAALRIRLLSKPPQVAHQLGTTNLEAYNEFLIGKQSYNQGDSEGYRRAVAAFSAAIEHDPNYAPAYASLALSRFWAADEVSSAGGYESAVAAADRAVALGPAQAASYAARGFLRAVYQFDFRGAQSDLSQAVALSPGDADVLHRSAVVLGIVGELQAAISREKQALALDPLSAEICMRLAFFLSADQQLAQARPLYEKALAIAENSTRARFNLGDLELLENQPGTALATFQQLKNEVFRLEGQAKAEYSLGHRDAADQALKQLIVVYASTAAWNIADVYAWRGEKQQAFAWAERACEQRDPGVTWIKIHPSFRGLRGDPRYHALLRKMRLADD